MFRRPTARTNCTAEADFSRRGCGLAVSYVYPGGAGSQLIHAVVILHQIDTDLTWTIFRFTDAGATKEITIEVDTPQIPAADWQASVTNFSKLVGSQAASLDLNTLEAGPKCVVQGIQAGWPGCSLQALTLYLQDKRLTLGGFLPNIVW